MSRGARVAVAVSGGADSITLLHVLAHLRGEFSFELGAIHVNHGLSPNAGAWEEFSARACAALEVPFAAVRLELALSAGDSPEAAARDARYSALAKTAAETGASVIALAQHADDQAETVMLQLLRGAAQKGLAAMPEWRRSGHGPDYWRPLLRTSREDILAYAGRHALGWVDDESNLDPGYKRNFLRMEIMPRLASGFPGYRTSLARAAAHASEAAQLLDQLAELDAARACDGAHVLVAGLRGLGARRAGNLLRWTLAQQGIAIPPAERLDEFVRQVSAAAPDRHPALDLGDDCRLEADRKFVRVTRTVAADAFQVIWRGERVVTLPHGELVFSRTTGGGFRATGLPESGLLVRSRRGGERLQVALDRPSRTLKNLMQEAGVPAAVRGRWPLLEHAGRLVAVPGIGTSVDWNCPPDEPGWHPEWVPGTTRRR